MGFGLTEFLWDGTWARRLGVVKSYLGKFCNPRRWFSSSTLTVLCTLRWIL